MVRIKGLQQTLGRVLGRSLGRQVSGDEEEAPQRQRSTSLARIEWAVAVVAKDIEHVDHAANEVREEFHDPIKDDVGVDSQGFLSRPQYTSMLTSYADYVAAKV